MATSPRYRRRKPRHARPRPRRLARPCVNCLLRGLEAMASPAGHVLLLHRPEPHLVLAALLLLCLHLASHQATCTPGNRPT